MKKIIIFTILISILLLSACSSKTTVKDPYAELENIVTDNNNSILIETDSVNLGDRTADCELLSMNDIFNVCNKQVIPIEAQVSGDAVCARNFMTVKGRILTFTYLDLGGTTPQQMVHCVEAMNGESLGEHSCFAANADNTAYVYGKRYTLVIKNNISADENNVCTNDELKSLSRLIESRIYD